jgi:predicted ATPase
LKQTFASKPNESDNVSEMEGKRLIEKIRLRNILSFGDKGEEIELQPLNILIGQNASGKSNFIETIKILKGCAEGRFADIIESGGGVDEFLWKGTMQIPNAQINCVFFLNDLNFICYKLVFTRIKQKVEIIEEEVRNTKVKDENVFYYRKKGDKEEIANWRRTTKLGKLIWGDIVSYHNKFNPQTSILSQIRETVDYPVAPVAVDPTSPVITEIGIKLQEILFFKDFIFNAKYSPRQPIQENSNYKFLSREGENLAVVINDLQARYFDAYQKIVEKFKLVYSKAEKLITRRQQGTLQLYFQEKGLETEISAARFSDGTLRYLCLLTILIHPEPPPLICLDEPETGLHPDILPTIGELLIEASKRTQLIVTTHSDILVSSFSEVPEAVLVCEANEDGTHLNRLDREKLKGWLKKYQLGDLWIRGEIGGTRW